jgi:medium-chain acyl-[acyl-carrier-protein] hydrolase
VSIYIEARSETTMSELLTSSPWVKINPQARGRVRLFCFPYAGGGCSAYLPWMNLISPDIELCPVQLPGREDRFSETPFTRIESLVEELAQALALYLDTPFAFYGHSLGALVSFELARYLRRQNGPGPEHLFVSGCAAPQFPAIDPPIHQLPDGEFIQALRELNGTPDVVLQNTELMRVLSPLLRADFALCETYTYSPEEPFGFPVSAYGGLNDARAPRESVEAWKLQTDNKFILRMYSGDHFFIHTKRNILLQGIRQDLTIG